MKYKIFTDQDSDIQHIQKRKKVLEMENINNLKSFKQKRKERKVIQFNV